MEMELIHHCICRENSCNKRECAPWLVFIFQMFPLKSWGQQQQEDTPDFYWGGKKQIKSEGRTEEMKGWHCPG